MARAAEKFVKSVAEGNSEYAKELFTDDAVLLAYLTEHLNMAQLSSSITMSIPWEPAKISRPVSMSSP